MKMDVSILSLSIFCILLLYLNKIVKMKENEKRLRKKNERVAFIKIIVVIGAFSIALIRIENNPEFSFFLLNIFFSLLLLFLYSQHIFILYLFHLVYSSPVIRIRVLFYNCQMQKPCKILLLLLPLRDDGGCGDSGGGAVV